MPGYKKIKMPKLVRHENFIAIKNMTQAQWTFQVAGLSKSEQEAKRKNEGSKLANLDETGTVTVTSAGPLERTDVEAAVSEAGYVLA